MPTDEFCFCITFSSIAAHCLSRLRAGKISVFHIPTAYFLPAFQYFLPERGVFMHRHKGWNPFWAALLASLLVLVPLVGGTVLLSHRQLRTQLRQAARSESGMKGGTAFGDPEDLPLLRRCCPSGPCCGGLRSGSGKASRHRTGEILSMPELQRPRRLS